MAIFTAGEFGVDMDLLDIAPLATAVLTASGPGGFSMSAGGMTYDFIGTGLAYGASGGPIAGTITDLQESVGGHPIFSLSGLSVGVATFFGWVANADSAAAKITLLSGADSLQGSDLADRLRGYDGDDIVRGGGGGDYLDGGEGNDSIFGGLGDDVIVDSAGSNYLRGEEGDDSMLGGAGFDDIQGNMGNDTESGGPGNDWVVGGKDNDLLFGDDGDDVMNGNLGDDTLDSGIGNDWVRGGQGGDVLSGGAGADWLSGDRGDDTLTGGSGADIFHSFGDAGIDRVLDFSIAQGDRIQLDLGTSYTVAQIGADTVLTMVGGAQMVLVGVSMSSLTASTIFLA